MAQCLMMSGEVTQIGVNTHIVVFAETDLFGLRVHPAQHRANRSLLSRNADGNAGDLLKIKRVKHHIGFHPSKIHTHIACVELLHSCAFPRDGKSGSRADLAALRQFSTRCTIRTNGYAIRPSLFCPLQTAWSSTPTLRIACACQQSHRAISIRPYCPWLLCVGTALTNLSETWVVGHGQSLSHPKSFVH